MHEVWIYMEGIRLRRLPGVEREIAKITGEEHRVSVLGVVVERDEINNSALIDDGTGRAVAYFSTGQDFNLAREGKVVRVIGKVRKDENVEIDVEIIQDMSKLDIGLYEQVKYVMSKIQG